MALSILGSINKEQECLQMKLSNQSHATSDRKGHDSWDIMRHTEELSSIRTRETSKNDFILLCSRAPILIYNGDLGNISRTNVVYSLFEEANPYY